MQIFNGINSFKTNNTNNANNTNNKNIVLAFGMFDGVHLGHKEVLSKAKKLTQKMGANYQLFVITFDTHPKSKLTLTTNEEKMYLFEQLGVQGIIFLYFDQKTSNMSAENFIKKDLLKKINPKAIVVGEDFRFGKDRKGDVNLLKNFCMLEVVPELKHKNTKISSTHIRKLIQAGDIKKANEFLGHSYFLKNQVIKGLGLATNFGVPTANIHIPKSKLLPLGVFKGFTNIDGTDYLSAISIGLRHTLGGKKRLCVETHIIDFNKDIYHKTVQIKLIEKIREQKKFQSFDSLFEQVKKDIENIKGY